MSRAHGKFILMGEHAVVYGHPAIAVPLNEAKIVIHTIEFDRNVIESDFYQGDIASLPEAFESIQTLFFSLQKDLELPNLKLIIEVNTVIGAGLGASATFAAALTRAMFHHNQTTLTENKLLSYIDLSENISHGKASGIDARAAISSQNFIYENGTIKPFPFTLDAYVIVVFTNVVGHTKKAVSKVKYMVDHDEKGVQLIETLAQHTNQAIQAIKQHDLIKLGHLMSLSHQSLKKLGVSHEALNTLVDLAIENGSYGAKLTGGGLGGCMIALCNQEVAYKIKAVVEEMGYKKTFIKYLGDKS